MLTNFNPFSWFKIPMVTLFVEWIRVVTVFICHMSHEGIPLCKDHFLKTSLGWGCTPVKMTPNSLHPIFNNHTSFFFTSTQQLFCHRPCHMPDVEEVFCIDTIFTNPFSNSSMPIWYKDCNGQTKSLQIIKTSLCTLKFCLLATPHLIGLKKINTNINRICRSDHFPQIDLKFLGGRGKGSQSRIQALFESTQRFFQCLTRTQDWEGNEHIYCSNVRL